MKLILFNIIFLFVTVHGYSQKLQKAFTQLQQNNFEKASEMFEKAIDKNSETVAAKYGLALIYNNKAYKNYNLVNAFRNIRFADQKYERLPESEKKTYSDIYNIDFDKIIFLKEQISSEALLLIKEKNTIDDYNWYISVFTGADKQVNMATQWRDSIAFTDAEKINTFRAYQEFAYNFPASNYVAEAKMRTEKLWRSVYSDYFAEGELFEINKFRQLYPDYPYYDEQSKNDILLAEYADKLMLYRPYNPSLKNYYFEYIKNAAPRELAYVSLLKLLTPYYEIGDWVGAINLLNQYKPVFPNHEVRITKLIDVLDNKDKKVIVENLSAKVNTDDFEYAPVITNDGKYLFFCGRNRPDNLGLEDIFVSEHSYDGWSVPILLPELNTAFNNEAPLSVSPDATKLLLYYDADIYMSEKRSYGWTPKSRFPVINNSVSWEADAMITSDGNALIFVSDRPGGIGRHHEHEAPFHGSLSGNTDIYVSVKTSKGWSIPFNIGTAINTPYAERSPFLHPDMKTMYFSSDGHSGLGRMDVFKTTRLSDTSWTLWSEPINLGKEINTASDEYNYRITTDGTIAYFSKFTNNNSDLCYIELPQEYRPNLVATVSGVVSDAQLKILEAEIKWENLSSGETLGALNSDPLTGKYFITLPMGKNYGYFVSKDGYYPVSGNIDLTKQNTSIHIERNIVLISIKDIIEKQIAIPLSNLFFDYDKFDLKPESYNELNRLIAFINQNATFSIEIAGHTDNSGKPDYNKKLSESRAISVKNYLIKMGCDGNKLSAVGYGQEKPIDSNATPEGRANNRRVEFKVVK